MWLRMALVRSSSCMPGACTRAASRIAWKGTVLGHASASMSMMVCAIGSCEVRVAPRGLRYWRCRAGAPVAAGRACRSAASTMPVKALPSGWSSMDAARSECTSRLLRKERPTAKSRYCSRISRPAFTDSLFKPSATFVPYVDGKVSWGSASVT
ncbi:hypothetical protein D3C86_1492720 [compost metagenome]